MLCFTHMRVCIYEVLMFTMWPFIGCLAQENYTVSPLSCEQIKCENNYVCHVTLINGSQVKDARCQCQGPWVGQKCELRMYLSVIQVTSDTATLQLNVKTNQMGDTRSLFQQADLAEVTLQVRNRNTTSQCMILQQQNIQGFIHLQGLAEYNEYTVCLANGRVESCNVLDVNDTALHSNCVRFESRPIDRMNQHIGIIVLCVTVVCCFLLSVLYIYTQRCDLLFSLIINALCCKRCRRQRRRIGRTSNKRMDGSIEDFSDTLMPPDSSMELLSNIFTTDHSVRSNGRLSRTKRTVQTIDDGESRTAHPSRNSTPPNNHNHVDIPCVETVGLISFETVSSDTLKSFEWNGSCRFPSSASQFFNAPSLTMNSSLSDYFYVSDSSQMYPDESHTLPRSKLPHKARPGDIYRTLTLPRDRKSKPRLSKLELSLPLSNNLKDLEKNTLQEKHSRKGSLFRFHRESKSTIEDEEFRELQSPLSDKPVKSFKNLSSSNMSSSSSIRSLSTFSSIFEGHPSEYYLPPFSPDDSYNEEDEDTQISFMDLSTSSLGFKDSISSYENDTSNLVTPFETHSDSDDNDTYKNVNSLTSSIDTLHEFSLLPNIH